MRSYNEFKQGLADIKGTSEFGGNEQELLSEMGQLLRDNYTGIMRVLRRTLHEIKMTTDEENAFKNFMGMIGRLKDSPHERKGKMKDPLDNVVIRAHTGADGSNNSGGGGGGGE
jgi:hypothetical protein